MTKEEAVKICRTINANQTLKSSLLDKKTVELIALSFQKEFPEFSWCCSEYDCMHYLDVDDIKEKKT